LGREPCARSPIKNGVGRTDGVSPTSWYGGRFGRNHTCVCPSGTRRTRHPDFNTTQDNVWSCEDGGEGVETPTLCEVGILYGEADHHRTDITSLAGSPAADPVECVCPEGSVETNHEEYEDTYRGIWSCVE